MNLQNIKSLKKKIFNFFYLIIIAIFSFSVNYYYGFIGINPIDQFTIFNSGYLIKNSNLPFKDYWTITGPLLDLIQYLFFLIFEINWNAFVLHSSTVNLILATLSYFFFKRIKLRSEYCFIYSIILSILFYPTIGTPFVDYHGYFFSIIFIYFLILAIKFEKNKYWFLLPILFFLSFFSKQTPISYILFFVFFLIIYYYFFFNKKFLKYLVYSLFLSLIIIGLIFNINKINLKDFLDQYLFFASTIGKQRLFASDMIFPFEFKRVIWRFKLIHISYFFLIFLLVKEIKNNFLFIKQKDFLIILIVIIFNNICVFNQLLTLNIIFIYFLIPINIAICHQYLLKYYNYKKFILINLSFLIICTGYYFLEYVDKRRHSQFRYLKNSNNIIFTDAKALTSQLSGLQWSSSLNKNSKYEIYQLNKIIKKIMHFQKKNKDNFILITDYQFIFSAFKINNKQLNKWYHPGVSYPNPDNKYFSSYKNYVKNFIIKNNVKKIIFIYPAHFDNEKSFMEAFVASCYFKEEKLKNLTIYNINKCI